MADCSICTKIVAVSLYVRAKPMFQVSPNRYKAASNDTHLFFGYWPKESQLGNYLKLEYERAKAGMHDPILQRLWDSNCHGHTFTDIVEAIEQKMPPVNGIAVKVLWNPSPKITPMLLADSWRDKADAHLETNNDLRFVTIFRKEDIAISIKHLLNNSQEEDIKVVSYPGIPELRSNGNVSSLHAF
jgi:hypothetical protein